MNLFAGRNKPSKIGMRLATLLLSLSLAACSQNVTVPSVETQAADPFKLIERTAPNCDETIEVAQTYVRASDVDYEPGDTICVAAGKRPYLKFIGFKGTSQAPLTFVNIGGQVQLGGGSEGLIFRGSNYFKLSGAGSSAHLYGFKIDGTSSKGLGFDGRADNFEVEFVEIANTGFAGLMAKSDDTNKGVPEAERWTMRNISIHDTYIHDTDGEGMYIGQTKTNRDTHDIHGVRIYNNVVTRTGWDGFQLANASKDVKIYNNIIRQTGLARKSYQANGFQLGSNTVAEVFDNVISEAHAQCAIMINTGKLDVWNNYLGDCGMNAVYVTNNNTSAIPANPAASYRYNYLRNIGSGDPFLYINNLVYPVTVTYNKLGGANSETGKSGGPSTLTVKDNPRAELPKVKFRMLLGGALCIAKGSFYDGKSLGPEVCKL